MINCAILCMLCVMSWDLCVYSHLSVCVIHLTGNGSYCQGRTLSWVGDHCTSCMTGFFSPRQSIWASTGFLSMPLFFTAAVNIIRFLKARLIDCRKCSSDHTCNLHTFGGCVVHQVMFSSHIWKGKCFYFLFFLENRTNILVCVYFPTRKTEHIKWQNFCYWKNLVLIWVRLKSLKIKCRSV